MEIISVAILHAISHRHTTRSDPPLHPHNVGQDIEVFTNVAMDNGCYQHFDKDIGISAHRRPP